jgi:hypothetical protein
MSDANSVETIAIDNELTQTTDSGIELSNPGGLDLFVPNDAGDGGRALNFYEEQYANIGCRNITIQNQNLALEQTVTNLQGTLEHQGNQIAMLIGENEQQKRENEQQKRENEQQKREIEQQKRVISFLIMENVKQKALIEQMSKRLDQQESQIKHLTAIIYQQDKEISRLIKIGSTFSKAIKTLFSFGSRKKRSREIVREVEPYVVKLMNDLANEFHEMGERRRSRSV